MLDFLKTKKRCIGCGDVIENESSIHNENGGLFVLALQYWYFNEGAFMGLSSVSMIRDSLGCIRVCD